MYTCSKCNQQGYSKKSCDKRSSLVSKVANKATEEARVATQQADHSTISAQDEVPDHQSQPQVLMAAMGQEELLKDMATLQMHLERWMRDPNYIDKLRDVY